MSNKTAETSQQQAHNFVSLIAAQATLQPQHTALVVPLMKGQKLCGEQRVDYQTLMAISGALQQGLRADGFVRGDRVVVLLRPGILLYALIIALLGAGMVPVFIDGGMPRATVRRALRAANARALISHRKLLWRAILLPEVRALRRYAAEGTLPFARSITHLQARPGNLIVEPLDDDDHGLITFTSGSTGVPKGANRTHGSLRQQHLAIRRHWPDQPGDIDMPSFPVLVLHNLCCGMTTVLPRADLAQPGQVNGHPVIEQIRSERISRLSGAPAYMQRLALAARERPECLLSLREIVIGGATVSPALMALLSEAFANTSIKLVYGSTEAEPIAEISLAEAIAADNDQGYLLGPAAGGSEVWLVNPDMPLQTEQDVEKARCLPGQVGELLVRGAHVLKGYIDNPEADRQNKIPCGSGLVWHRTGDTAFSDPLGRLWLVGRLRERVRGMDVLPLEKMLERAQPNCRVALLQQTDAAQSVLLCIAGEASLHNLDQHALGNLCRRLQLAQLPLYLLDTLPVDARHNSKLDRARLRQLVTRRTPDHCFRAST